MCRNSKGWTQLKFRLKARTRAITQMTGRAQRVSRPQGFGTISNYRMSKFPKGRRYNDLGRRYNLGRIYKSFGYRDNHIVRSYKDWTYIYIYIYA